MNIDIISEQFANYQKKFLLMSLYLNAKDNTLNDFEPHVNDMDFLLDLGRFPR
jgi:hypothetical protein